jgi:hypothetical protein
MLREGCLAVTAVLLCALTGIAQEPDSDRDVLVLNHTFQSGSREFVRVFLMGGEVYRAEIDLGQVSFSIRPRDPGGQPPTVVPIREADEGGAEAVFEIYPFRDAEYEVQVLDVPSGETGKLRIYRDVRASRRRQLAAKGAGGSGWKLGLELSAGFHSSYRLSFFEEFLEVERSGGDYEGCLSLRSEGRAWGCLIGGTQHSNGEGAAIVWFFIEPRFRLIGGLPGDPLELGALIRLGFGSADEGMVGASYDHPGLAAPGVYFRYWLGSPGRGLSLSVAGRKAFVLGSQVEGASFTHFGGGLAYHF